MRRTTVYTENALEEKEADALYEKLEKLPWKQGVRSRTGTTRLAHNLDLNSCLGEEILDLVEKVLKNDPTNTKYIVFGVYLNYYKNGDMYTPNHTHKGTHQLVISLGATRSLVLGKKGKRMKNGDAILFGSSLHGVPKEPDVKEGRISIATFMLPLSI